MVEKKIRTPRKHNPAWRPKFLAAMRSSGNVRASCTASGVSRGLVYDLRAKDPEFATEWDEALSDAIDMLELTAWTRAKSGLSDGMLMWLLKAHRRSFYGDRIQVTVTHDQRVTTLVGEGFTREEAEAAVEEAERIATSV